jgi:hypothetical protein
MSTRARVVDDLQHVKDPHEIVREFEDDAAVASEHHLALHRGSGRCFRFFLLLARGRIGEASDKDHSQPAGRRDRERIRLEPLAFDVCGGAAVRTRRQPLEFGAPLLVGDRLLRLAIDRQRDLLADHVVAKRLAHDTNRHRSCLQLTRGNSFAVDDRGIRHVDLRDRRTWEPKDERTYEPENRRTREPYEPANRHHQLPN